MRRNLILLLVLLLLGALVWWLAAERGTGTLAGPLADFAVADTSKVTRIFIAEHNGRSVDLTRAADGWRVNGNFRAKKYNVDLLLKTFLRAEVRSPVPKSAEANVLKTMSSAARKVEVYEGGQEPSKVWYVGHATQEHVGTYMLLEIPGEGRSSEPFIVGMSGFTGHLSSRFHSDLDEWRSSEVFVFNDPTAIAAIRVDHPREPATSFSVDYAGGNTLVLKDGTGAAVPMDSLAVKDFLLQFKKLNYEYIDRNITRSKRDSLTATIPNTTVTAVDRSGVASEVKIWLRKPDAEGVDASGAPLQYDVNRMYGLMADTVLVVIQRHMFDRITIPLNDLRAH
ncbi:MAG: hypothetical protein ABI599_17285 [Flavobacteriales bacterium]